MPEFIANGIEALQRLIHDFGSNSVTCENRNLEIHLTLAFVYLKAYDKIVFPRGRSHSYENRFPAGNAVGQ